MYKKIINMYRIVRAVLGPYKRTTIFLIILMIIVAVLETFSIGMILPLTGAIIDAETYYGESEYINQFVGIFLKIVPNSQSKLLSISLLFLIIIIIKNLLVYFNSLVQQNYFLNLRKYWSTNLFTKYINADYTYLLSEKRGTMINNILNESMISTKFIGNIITLTSKITIMIFLVIFMLFIDWKITSATFLSIIIFGTIFSYFSNNRAKQIGKKRLAIMQKITSQSEQSLNAIRQVKLFNLENIVINNFYEKINIWKSLSYKIQLMKNIPVPAGEIIIIGIFVSLIFIADINDNIQMATFIPLMGFIMFSLQKLYQNVSLFLSQGTMLFSYIPSINLIYNILENQFVEPEEKSGKEKISGSVGNIELNNVSYSIGSKKILNKVNLIIKEGSVIGITGHSGSGKSTVADLLSGLIKNYTGEILIDNSDLKQIKISSLRKKIAFVSQDSFLFNSSIKDNITIANKDLTENDIIQYAKEAQAYDFIMKQKNKFDTLVEDRGLSLSGGERQRLTIARAFACNSRILVFDEGLSAIDKNVKLKILNHLLKIKKQGKIIIIISHQMNTLEIADKIYKIEDSKLKSFSSAG